MATRSILLLLSCLLASLLFVLPRSCASWQWQVANSPPPSKLPSSASASPSSSDKSLSTRRSILLHSPYLAAITTASTILSTPTAIANADVPPGNTTPDLQFITTPSGLQYADVKLGSTSTSSPTNGQVVSIDYIMSTTGARYGSKIYSTVEAGQPYRWKLGDGSTIPGLEEAVSSMTPGGIRRVIIPAKLAYQSKAALSIRDECENGKGLGPIPPASEAIGEFQRFKNIYCNPDRVYQPDLVMDVKLYGKR
ncbi:hypothetical protein ACHAWU_001674 [Discostella pseudostelligera]|uniref:peptidylprolyl isomerase n=1 Tax=Discostella pseudostelligera TaxID=259834 RepID=A0ABD3MFL6_9STRA